MNIAARVLKTGCCLLILINLALPAWCQDTATQSPWYFGIVGGANFNSYNGSTSALNADINISPALNRGRGIGGYYGALLEYHPQASMWGLRLQQGGDSRRGIFKANGNRLEANIGYFSIEPAILFKPLKYNFYLYAGPQLGLLWATGFTYQEQGYPEYPQKNVHYPAYIKNMDKITVSMHVGAGYNFMFSQGKGHQFIVSPFITYLPSLDQNLRTIESLQVNTIRAGIVLKTTCFK